MYSHFGYQQATHAHTQNAITTATTKTIASKHQNE